jgi:hypothetical protein
MSTNTKLHTLTAAVNASSANEGIFIGLGLPSNTTALVVNTMGVFAITESAVLLEAGDLGTVIINSHIPGVMTVVDHSNLDVGVSNGIIPWSETDMGFYIDADIELKYPIDWERFFAITGLTPQRVFIWQLTQGDWVMSYTRPCTCNTRPTWPLSFELLGDIFPAFAEVSTDHQRMYVSNEYEDVKNTILREVNERRSYLADIATATNASEMMVNAVIDSQGVSLNDISLDPSVITDMQEYTDTSYRSLINVLLLGADTVPAEEDSHAQDLHGLSALVKFMHGRDARTLPEAVKYVINNVTGAYALIPPYQPLKEKSFDVATNGTDTIYLNTTKPMTALLAKYTGTANNSIEKIIGDLFECWESDEETKDVLWEKLHNSLSRLASDKVDDTGKVVKKGSMACLSVPALMYRQIADAVSTIVLTHVGKPHGWRVLQGALSSALREDLGNYIFGRAQVIGGRNPLERYEHERELIHSKNGLIDIMFHIVFHHTHKNADDCIAAYYQYSEKLAKLLSQTGAAGRIRGAKSNDNMGYLQYSLPIMLEYARKQA